MDNCPLTLEIDQRKRQDSRYVRPSTTKNAATTINSATTNNTATTRIKIDLEENSRERPSLKSIKEKFFRKAPQP